MIEAKRLKILETLTAKRAAIKKTESQIEKAERGEFSLVEGKGIGHIQLDASDSGTDELVRALSAELAKSEIREIQEIESAMNRLERGVYGECEGCGDSISTARLKAIPETRFCIECKEAMEVQSRRIHRPNIRDEMAGFANRDSYARGGYR